ncbi:hypothetical protein GCM10010094_30810 [Streptomyces flaveus]|uniref:Uncharacterized protein n=1 Tax=Streptomyces flaveus TaxID=66370 RepID=A0A917VEH0_9ACTN|nr:hypothetical protein GCM10010094_30810 [Streptomyces flaveus]
MAGRAVPRAPKNLRLPGRPGKARTPNDPHLALRREGSWAGASYARRLGSVSEDQGLVPGQGRMPALRRADAPAHAPAPPTRPRGAGNCASNHDAPAAAQPPEAPRGELRDQPRRTRSRQRTEPTLPVGAPEATANNRNDPPTPGQANPNPHGNPAPAGRVAPTSRPRYPHPAAVVTPLPTGGRHFVGLVGWATRTRTSGILDAR